MNKLLFLLFLFSLSALSAESSNFIFGYCEDMNVEIGSGKKGATMGAAIEIPESLAQQWKGAVLEEIIVGFGRSSNPQISLFISEDLDSEPILTQDAVMTMSMDWNPVNLDYPYVITGKRFFVGFRSVSQKSEDCPVVIDYTPTTTEYGDYLEFNGTWDHYRQYYGCVCLKIGLSGDNLPQYKVGISDLQLPEFTVADSPFEVSFNLKNNGQKSIEELTIWTCIDEEISTSIVNLDKEIKSGEKSKIIVPNLICGTVGQELPVSIIIMEINSVKEELPEDNELTGFLNCGEFGFRRNVLVEEFTGSWCGYCPLGIVGMDYMKEKYGDKGYIGVAGHIDDPLESSSYIKVIEQFTSGSYPNAMINRNFNVIPYSYNLEELYLQESKYPTYLNISLTCELDEDTGKLTVSSFTEFAKDMEATNLELAFILTENNLGPYTQTNFYANNKEGEMGGWENLGSKVSTIYNEVAREIISPFGIVNSLPSEIKKGKSYNFSIDFDIKELKINNCEIIALVIEGDTGRVLNCCRESLANTDTGIEKIADENIFNVYNLQGRKVIQTKSVESLKNLPEDFYIINGKKVILGNR